MGTMVVIVHGVTVAINGIDSVHIIHIAIAIVVKPRNAFLFSLVDPDIALQVLVVVVYARIDNGNDEIPRARGLVPGLRRIDIRIG